MVTIPLYFWKSRHNTTISTLIALSIVATLSTTSLLQFQMTLLLQFQVRHHSYKSEYKVCQHNGQQYSQWIGNNPHIGKCREASGQPKDKFISLPTIAQLIRVNTHLILTKIWQYQCKWRMINSNGYPSIPPFFYTSFVLYKHPISLDIRGKNYSGDRNWLLL